MNGSGSGESSSDGTPSPERRAADAGLAEARQTSVRRLQATWEDIFRRYGAIAEEEDDIIDLRTETVVVDKGMIRGTPSRRFGNMLTEVLGPELSPLIGRSTKKRRRRDLEEEKEGDGDDDEDEPIPASPSVPPRKFAKKKRLLFSASAATGQPSSEAWDADDFDNLYGEKDIKSEINVKTEPSSPSRQSKASIRSPEQNEDNWDVGPIPNPDDDDEDIVCSSYDTSPVSVKQGNSSGSISSGEKRSMPSSPSSPAERRISGPSLLSLDLGDEDSSSGSSTENESDESDSEEGDEAEVAVQGEEDEEEAPEEAEENQEPEEEPEDRDTGWHVETADWDDGHAAESESDSDVTASPLKSDRSRDSETSSSSDTEPESDQPDSGQSSPGIRHSLPPSESNSPLAAPPPAIPSPAELKIDRARPPAEISSPAELKIDRAGVKDTSRSATGSVTATPRHSRTLGAAALATPSPAKILIFRSSGWKTIE